jgi:hypothetical protein
MQDEAALNLPWLAVAHQRCKAPLFNNLQGLGAQIWQLRALHDRIVDQAVALD